VPVKLQLLRTDDADLTRFAQLVQLAFDRVPSADDRISLRASSSQVIPGNVDFVFADPSSGAITLTLPTTGTFTVTVRNISDLSRLSVQAASAAKVNGTTAVVTVPAQSSVAFRYDSTSRIWRTV
jgi:hypothetical protein